MKDMLAQLVHTALAGLHSTGAISCEPPDNINIDRTRDKSHGDFATNIAMVLSKQAGMKPRDLAEMIIKVTMTRELIKKNLSRFPLFIYKPPLMFIFINIVASSLQSIDDRPISNLSIWKSQRL